MDWSKNLPTLESNELNNDVGRMDVYRYIENDSYTISRFRIWDANIEGYFMEPAGPSSMSEGSGLRIVSGEYQLVPHSGVEFQNVIRLENVPGRSGILIHIGNYPSSTAGCFLPGECYSSGMVTRSGDHLRLILNYYNSINFNFNNARMIIR